MKPKFINRNNKYTNTVSRYIDLVEDHMISYTGKSIVNHFGKVIELAYGSPSYYNVLTMFLAKYDPKYNDRLEEPISSSKSAYLNGEMFQGYKEGVFLIKLDKGTFALASVGDFTAVTEMSGKYTRFNENKHPRDMLLYIFGKKSPKFIKFVTSISNKVVSNKSKIALYNVSSNKYDNYSSSSDGRQHAVRESLNITRDLIDKRDLSTLYFSNGEIETICKHIERFNEDKEFYSSRQLLYKTGILFKGEPGTGKSSLVKAIASEFDRDIVNIVVSDIESLDLATLTSAINNQANTESCDDRPFIILFEDIDTLFLNRVKEDGNDERSSSIINKLLQFLDSNTSPTNVIFIATTNHPEKLDEALLRRFDLKINIGPLNRSVALEYLKSFEIHENIANNILDEIDSKSSRHGIYNQKTLQDYAISNKQNKSIEEIKKIYKFDGEEETEEAATAEDDIVLPSKTNFWKNATKEQLEALAKQSTPLSEGQLKIIYSNTENNIGETFVPLTDEDKLKLKESLSKTSKNLLNTTAITIVDPEKADELKSLLDKGTAIPISPDNIIPLSDEEKAHLMSLVEERALDLVDRDSIKQDKELPEELAKEKEHLERRLKFIQENSIYGANGVLTDQQLAHLSNLKESNPSFKKLIVHNTVGGPTQVIKLANDVTIPKGQPINVSDEVKEVFENAIDMEAINKKAAAIAWNSIMESNQPWKVSYTRDTKASLEE